MERTVEQKFFIEFIELYETLPALWDTLSKKHCDKTLKCEQYSVLLEKYKQWDPKGTLDDMKKKINALRTNYRREKKRLLCLRKGEPDEEYYAAANLYYFKAMDFLRNCEAPPTAVLGVSVENNDCSENEPKPKKKKGNNSIDELVRLATQRLKSTQSSYHQIASVWGSKLTKMDQSQRIIAEKIINDVMFNGELGLLNYDTTLTNIGSVCNLNSSSSSISNIITNTNEVSVQNRIGNNYNTNDINQQRYSDGHIKYPSPSLLISSDVITDHESDQMEDNFIVAEYDPLANSIKIEDKC